MHPRDVLFNLKLGTNWGRFLKLLSNSPNSDLLQSDWIQPLANFIKRQSVTTWELTADSKELEVEKAAGSCGGRMLMKNLLLSGRIQLFKKISGISRKQKLMVSKWELQGPEHAVWKVLCSHSKEILTHLKSRYQNRTMKPLLDWETTRGRCSVSQQRFDNDYRDESLQSPLKQTKKKVTVWLWQSNKQVEAKRGWIFSRFGRRTFSRTD